MVKKKKRSKAWWLPKVAFPRIKDFKQLFTVVKERQQIYNDGFTVSTYCMISEMGTYKKSIEVMPNEKLLKFIRENTIRITGGLFFEIVIHDDGKALVIVKYNCICGSRWLAKVQATSLPE